MTDTWKTCPATEIEAGVIIRLRTGDELEVTRIESPFMGYDTMLAFIEDTPRQWFKAPFAHDADVEYRSK